MSSSDPPPAASADPAGAPAASPHFERVALIGVGLLGASLGLALKRGGLAGEIVGAARSRRTVATAKALGVIDRAAETPEEAVANADLVVYCTPIGAIGAVAERVRDHLRPGAIVTDVGSVKQAVIDAVAPHLPSEPARRVAFVPGHPVAGTEQSGPEAGFAELFDDRWCILTPLADTPPEATARVRALWEAIGARVDAMTPEHHDRVLAITSHLPHLIAYSIVGTADDLERVTRTEVLKYSAGGFRDFTRIAASDPTMWRDVFLSNREAVLELLGRFTEDLVALQRAIRWGEGDKLFDHFTHTRAVRREIVELGQDTADPDFGRRASAERAAEEASEGGGEAGDGES